MPNIYIIIILLIVVVAIVIITSTSNSSEDYKKYYPQTYYDQGGWIEGPPQMPRYNREEMTYPSTDEPPPLNLPGGGRDLCQQCIGHCQLKLWAGVISLPAGEEEKEFCTGKCKYECNVLD